MTAKRAAAGESSISKGTDGRWHGYVSMGLKRDGHRDRRHVSGARRTDVVTKVRALEQQRDSGLVQAAGKVPTVGQWLDHWLDTIAARKVRRAPWRATAPRCGTTWGQASGTTGWTVSSPNTSTPFTPSASRRAWRRRRSSSATASCPAP